MVQSDKNPVDDSPGYRKSIFILTASYPYRPGEEFLESEIPLWSRQFDGRIVLIPAKATGKPRPLPTNIKLSSSLSDAYKSIVVRARALVTSFFLPVFWKEIRFLRQNRRLSARMAFQALKAVTHFTIARIALNRAIRIYGRPDTIYTYWFGYQTFAATAVAPEALIVTRAHSGDLYEDRSPANHMFLKRQFLNSVDRIYVISRDGVRYMRDIFHAEENVSLSRLGVEIPSLIAAPSEGARLAILSISLCVPVKNIDRIIDMVRIVVLRRPELAISWMHIGDGPLRPMLEARADSLFAGTSVDWRFLGQMENSAVLRYLETHPVDFILNASSSEGIPVSIMEAMARGIPAVAPNVGGISELVCDENGVLLDADPSGEDIANVVLDRIGHIKSAITRQNAAATVRQDYNREVNYRMFIEDMIALQESEDRNRPGVKR